MSENGTKNSKNSRFEEFSGSINRRWKVYIDTCSLYNAMEDGNSFWKKFVPVLQENGCKFIITVGTFEEIKKHKRGDKTELAETASELEKVLYRFKKDQLDLMLTVGEPGEFHDQAIQAKIRERALAFNQVYITNDLANAWDVYNSVVNSQSVNRDLKKLLIYKITRRGDLVRHDQLQYLSELNQYQIGEFFTLWHDKKYREAGEYLQERTDYVPYWIRGTKTRIEATAELEEVSTNAAIDDENDFEEPVIQSILNPDYTLPGSGAKLRAVRGEKVSDIVLGERVSKGGEGFIYAVETPEGSETPYLAKVYRKTKLYKTIEGANETMLKINYIVGCGFYRQQLRNGGYLGDSIKFPLYVLVNDDDEFVGYLMSKASGIELARLIANGAVESEFRRLYPRMTKLDLIDICINFLKAITELHRRDMVVGDLNANNILVNPENNEVFLIDADSYQYGDQFACNVGVEKYTSPEFLENHDGKFRTEQNELFVVARILFEILMMVDNPYNSKVAQDPIGDMINGRFRYAFEFLNEDGVRMSNREAPAEDLEIRWGQLTRTIKNTFGNTFHKNGGYWEPGKRRSASRWIHCLEDYRDEIEESIAKRDGIVSNDVFPTERRKWITHFTCKICGESGEQEPNEFRKIVYPRIRAENIAEIARNYHFECYCMENWLVDVECSICGTDMGFGMLHRDDGKDYICEECWTKTACTVCGLKYARWMLDDKGRCKTCHAKTTKCKDCKRPITKKEFERNDGRCDDCADRQETYCARCGEYIGMRIPRKDGKEQYCRDCWKPTKCTSCGWDNHGKLVVWMTDERGRCRRCSKGAGYSTGGRIRPTTSQGKRVMPSYLKEDAVKVKPTKNLTREEVHARAVAEMEKKEALLKKKAASKKTKPKTRKTIRERLFGK